jgi:hypothetical protein
MVIPPKDTACELNYLEILYDDERNAYEFGVLFTMIYVFCIKLRTNKLFSSLIYLFSTQFDSVV